MIKKKARERCGEGLGWRRGFGLKVWHLSVPALLSREILGGMKGAVVITRDLDMVRIGVGWESWLENTIWCRRAGGLGSLGESVAVGTGLGTRGGSHQRWQ